MLDLKQSKDQSKFSFKVVQTSNQFNQIDTGRNVKTGSFLVLSDPVFIIVHTQTTKIILKIILWIVKKILLNYGFSFTFFSQLQIINNV